MAVFECRHDYPSPIAPERTIAFALSAAPEGAREDLLEQLRENGDGGNNLEAVNAVLARGALLSLAHYADGEDVLTFFPTPNLDDAVIVYSEDGLLDVADHGFAGTMAPWQRARWAARRWETLPFRRLAPDPDAANRAQ